MNAAVRLTSYAAALALVFGAAWGIGAAVAKPATTAPTHDLSGTADMAGMPDMDSTAGTAGTAAPTHSHGTGVVASDGLVSTAAGYTFVPQSTTLEPGAAAEYAFAITGSDGNPVTAFDVEQDKQLHLVVVRRDGAGYQHLHPVLGTDGLWRVPLTLPAAGVYRVFADFIPTGGPPLVLGTDLFAPGVFAPVPATATRVSQADGYQVRFDGDLVPGAPSQVFATISKDGAGVADLQPWLGSFGHLVVLRQNDLDYLHVHPGGSAPAPTDRSGPAVAFTAQVPTAGTYLVYLDFQHAGVVHTAQFIVTTRGTS